MASASAGHTGFSAGLKLDTFPGSIVRDCRLRVRGRLTQADFGALLGRSGQWVYRQETGVQNLDFRDVLALYGFFIFSDLANRVPPSLRTALETIQKSKAFERLG